MESLNKKWTLLEDIIAGTFFVSGLTIIFYGVVMRYIFNTPKSWVGEISIYFLIWAALLGISVALRNQRHIQVDILYDIMPSFLKWITDIFATSIGILFCLFYTYYSVVFVISRYSSGMVSLDVGIPMWIVYLILPISGIMFLIRFIERLVIILRKGGGTHDSTPI